MGKCVDVDFIFAEIFLSSIVISQLYHGKEKGGCTL